MPGRLVGSAMPVVAAIPLFLVSLSFALAAARLFARRLDQLGVRFGFPETLIGLLTALAADGPEISSALYAVVKGSRSVGVGVLVGSGAFNFAAMIGISALIAGSVMLPRNALLLEGLLGASVTMIAAAVLVGWLAAPIAAVLTACCVVPYLAIVVGGTELLAHAARIPGAKAARTLSQTLAQRPHHEGSAGSNPARHLVALVAIDVLVIVGGSVGMVQAALSLGEHWHVSPTVLGVLILAPLTSIPNAVTGVRLGLAGRGAALVGETFNSNTLNFGAGVIVPALLTTVVASTSAAKLQLAWLVAMTLVCLALLARPRGLRRGGAAALIVMYGVFALTQVVTG